MNTWFRNIVLMAFIACLPGFVQAQETAMPVSTVSSLALSPEAEALQIEIAARISQFSSELNQLLAVGKVNLTVDSEMGVSKSVVSAMEQRMQSLNQTYNQIDVKWNTYYQAQQMDIANSEDLMDKVAKIEELKQTVKDTLDAKTQVVEAVANFAAADQFIISQVDVYKNLYSKAFKLSLVQQLAPKLEKVKAKEQILFSELQTNYNQAKAACELVPSLSKRLEVLDEQYVIMKSVSEKVQALEYQPFIQRVKDYVLGLACVAVILLFLNGMLTKFKAYREKVASLKKYNEMLKNNGKDTTYPTI
jgi:hypothetical protein